MAMKAGNVSDLLGAIFSETGNDWAITWISFTNYTGGAVTLDIHIVPNGGSADNTNLVLDGESVAANDTISLYTAGEKLLLEDGAEIHAVAGAATSINYVISYTSI